MKSFAWLQKQNHKKTSKPNQTHHQSKIKDVTKTTSSKNSWRANWAHENLKRIPFSTEHFLYTSGTRNSQAINRVLQEKKDGYAVPGHGKECCWPPLCPPPCLCPSIVQARFWCPRLFLQQPSMRNSYQGWLHELETSEIPYWHKLRRNGIKFTLNSNFMFSVRNISGKIRNHCCRVWSVHEDQSSTEQQEQWRKTERERVRSLFNTLMLKQSNKVPNWNFIL